MFNNIRLSYLDELENDPDVLKSLDKSGPILDEWIHIGDGDERAWPKSFVEKKSIKSRPGKFNIPNYLALFAEDNIVAVLEGTCTGDFSYASNDVDFYYNEKFDATVFKKLGSSFTQEQINKCIVVATLHLYGVIPGDHFMRRRHTMAQVEELYEKWKNDDL